MKTIVLPRPKSSKVLSITMQAPFEDLQGVPTPLPSAEPGAAQVSWTVGGGDLPVFSLEPSSRMLIGMLYAGGKNTVAASRTLYWRMKKNGASVRSGSLSITANYYWTISAFFQNIAVNDVLELALWASVAGDVDWDYEAHQVHFSRVMLGDTVAELLSPFQLLDVTVQPTLTLGNPQVASTGASYVYVCGVSSTIGFAAAGIDFVLNTIDATYGYFRTFYGDWSASDNISSSTSATYRPRYYRGWMPGTIYSRNFGEIT